MARVRSDARGYRAIEVERKEKGSSIERNKVSSASRVRCRRRCCRCRRRRRRRRRLTESRRNETRDSVKEKGVVESFLSCTPPFTEWGELTVFVRAIRKFITTVNIALARRTCIEIGT